MNSTQVEKIKKTLSVIFEKNGVKRAALFGSIVRGDATENSDIDLLVEFHGRKSLFDLSGLKLDVEEALGRHADVLTYDSLHPLLRDRVLKEKVSIL
ncbi:MAG: nucleotidyltransferase family protein [Thermodesulfobacteriota bacterium]